MLDIDTLIESKGLYQTTMPTGARFTWRLLLLKEYRVFRRLLDANIMHPFVVYTKVFERCYLGNANLISSQTPAGMIISIGELILWLSGDCSSYTIKQDIEQARNNYPAGSVEEYLKRIVLIAFPGYVPDDLEGMTRVELLEKFTIAEAVLVNKGGYEQFKLSSIMSSEQAAQKQAAVSSKQMARDNREIAGSVGTDGPGSRHVLDADPTILGSKMQNRKQLDAREARRLDRMQREIKRAGRGNRK
jgi:hypothetical protein